MKELKDFFGSGNLRYIVYGFGGVFVSLLIFHAGLSIGARHQLPPGREGFQWRFSAPGFDIDLPGGAMQDGHGVVGVIEQVASSSVVVRNRNGSTRTVVLTGDTHVRGKDGNASTTALSVGQMVVILGTPEDDDSITADLVRFLPVPKELGDTNQRP